MISRTDKLDMSYGELANMYSQEELVIRPEYQQFFGGKTLKKSNLSNQYF